MHPYSADARLRAVRSFAGTVVSSQTNSVAVSVPAQLTYISVAYSV
jgi:hypothetical protein